MKSKKPTFEEVAFDATFKIVGVEVLRQEEKYAWCSFCGGRLRHPVLLERNAGTAFRVGKTCIGRVGLELTGSEKTVWKRKRPKEAKPKPRGEEPKKEMHPGYKKALEEYKKERAEEFTKELHRIFDEAEEKKKEEELEKEEVEKFRKEIERLVKGEKKPKVEEGEDYFSLDDVFED